jgi:hypothetical protein
VGRRGSVRSPAEDGPIKLYIPPVSRGALRSLSAILIQKSISYATAYIQRTEGSPGFVIIISVRAVPAYRPNIYSLIHGKIKLSALGGYGTEGNTESDNYQTLVGIK